MAFVTQTKCLLLTTCGKVYFTSSKDVAELRVQHGDPDIIIVDQEFSTAEKAIVYESDQLKLKPVVSQLLQLPSKIIV